MEIKFTAKDIISRGVVEIIEEKNFLKKLKSGKKLRVKLGIDPNSPDIHLGHTASLWKVRQFQEMGHVAVLIIGDYTALIGDPTGKDKTRPELNKTEIDKNVKQYKAQVLKILNKNNLEFHKQSEWFKDFSLSEVIKLASCVPVGSLLSHKTFRTRLKEGQPFASHELLYPLLQGYDSYAIKADVEIGASEQKFNLLMGRAIQEHYGMEPQDVLMTQYILEEFRKRPQEVLEKKYRRPNKLCIEQ